MGALEDLPEGARANKLADLVLVPDYVGRIPILGAVKSTLIVEHGLQLSVHAILMLPIVNDTSLP